MAEKAGFFGLVIAGMMFLAACGDALGDKYVGFAQCLTQKGTVMYGAYWCPHCTNQKARFGAKGFEAVKYVECDARGAGANPKLCAEKKIRGYPTWDFPDGSRKEREMELKELSEITKCPLPAEAHPAEAPAPTEAPTEAS